MKGKRLPRERGEREGEREVTTSAGQRHGIEKRIFLRLSSLLRFSDTVVQAQKRESNENTRRKGSMENDTPGCIEN